MIAFDLAQKRSFCFFVLFLISLLTFLPRGIRCGIETQTFQLCGTSAMSSLASSGFSGSVGTRFVDATCDVVQNAFNIKIFNAVESINCLSTGQISSTTFSVLMRCSGADNEGRGITGSISSVTLNGTSQIRSGITLKNSETSGNILVTLDDPNASINGRSCSLTLIADLWAQETPGGVCSSCIGQPILEVTRTCGWVGENVDDCHFFDLFCHFYEGIWPESSFFYIVFNSVIYIFVAIIYMIILNGRSKKMRALSLEINKSQENSSSSGRTSKKPVPKKPAGRHYTRHKSSGSHDKHKKNSAKKNDRKHVHRDDHHHKKKRSNSKKNKKDERSLLINDNTDEKTLLLNNNETDNDQSSSTSSSDSESSEYYTSSSGYSSSSSYSSD